MAGAENENAIARIEAALARIARASEARPSGEAAAGQPANVAALVNEHERMREDVAGTIRELDKLIEELEQ